MTDYTYVNIQGDFLIRDQISKLRPRKNNQTQEESNNKIETSKTEITSQEQSKKLATNSTQESLDNHPKSYSSHADNSKIDDQNTSKTDELCVTTDEEKAQLSESDSDIESLDSSSNDESDQLWTPVNHQ